MISILRINIFPNMDANNISNAKIKKKHTVAWPFVQRFPRACLSKLHFFEPVAHCLPHRSHDLKGGDN